MTAEHEDLSTSKRSTDIRLQRMEDLLAIQRLCVDYGRHLDSGDFNAYADLFCEDGEILLGVMGRARGRENIRRLMRRQLSSAVGSSFHIISTPSVELEGDHARSEVMWTAIRRDDHGRPHLSSMGRHCDRLRKDNGQWRFLRRVGQLFLPDALPPRTGSPS
jgi:uncharacterized protein (TIGR02246 family)